MAGTNYNVAKLIVEDQHTVSDTALSLEDFTGITAAQVALSSRMWLVVNSGAIRCYYGGTTPTTSSGAKFSAGNDIVLTGDNNLALFEVIRDGVTTDAEVVVFLEG